MWRGVDKDAPGRRRTYSNPDCRDDPVGDGDAKTDGHRDSDKGCG